MLATVFNSHKELCVLECKPQDLVKPLTVASGRLFNLSASALSPMKSHPGTYCLRVQDWDGKVYRNKKHQWWSVSSVSSMLLPVIAPLLPLPVGANQFSLGHAATSTT